MQYFKTLPNRKIVEYVFLNWLSYYRVWFDIVSSSKEYLWHKFIEIINIEKWGKINVFTFPLYFLSKNFSSKTHPFCSNFWNKAFLLYCHSRFHHMSVMSQSSIKVTSMTHINSFAVKMKSERTSKWNLIMRLW